MEKPYSRGEGSKSIVLNRNSKRRLEQNSMLPEADYSSAKVCTTIGTSLQSGKQTTLWSREKKLQFQPISYKLYANLAKLKTVFILNQWFPNSTARWNYLGDLKDAIVLIGLGCNIGMLSFITPQRFRRAAKFGNSCITGLGEVAGSYFSNKHSDLPWPF